MKFFLGLLIGLFLAVGIAAAGAYVAFGNITDIGERDKSKDVTESYELVDFDEIDIAGVYEIDVTVGPDYSVVLSGAPEEMELVEARVVNGELTLDRSRPERGKRRWRQFGVTATVSMPSLVAIKASGVVDGDITGVDAEDFRADLSGVGSLDLEGVCGSFKAHVSGVGDLDARELKCKSVDIDVSGVGEASIYASEEVDASVGGIGSISVYGSPSRVDKNGGPFADISVK